MALGWKGRFPEHRVRSASRKWGLAAAGVAVETTGGCAAPTPIMEVLASLVASAALADPWEVAAAGL